MNGLADMVFANIAVAAGIFLGSVALLAVCWVYVRHRQLGAFGGGLAVIGAILLIASIVTTAEDPGIDELRSQMMQLEGTQKQTGAGLDALREELRPLGSGIAELNSRLDDMPDTHRRLAEELRGEMKTGLDELRADLDELRAVVDRCHRGGRCPPPPK